LKFYSSKQELEAKTIELIHGTFKNLRSAEGAFDLLQNFKNIATLENISRELQKQYTEVLQRYRSELTKNRELFETDRNNLLVSKNKPPIAGSISWARAIYYRIKRPILKFKQKEQALKEPPDLFPNIKKEYLEVANMIYVYQKEKFSEWSDKIIERAMSYLKNCILDKKDGKYLVNFPEDFKILIKEAKSLEKMGYKISKILINICLQEKEYQRYVDRLHFMLREYDDAINTLSDIDRKLLSEKITEVNSKLEPGTDSYNLCSLGIPDFIDDCIKKINEFRDIKKNVNKNASMIEDIIKSIEDAQILKDFDFESRRETNTLPSVFEFYAYFEDHMQKVVNELVDKYKIIGDQLLKSIEEHVHKNSSRACKSMREYYYYWERRVYNALVKMILRALLSFKNLIAQQNVKQQIPLFQITAEYNHPFLNLQPPITEVEMILRKLLNNILHTSDLFWRWKDGTCIFCPTSKGPNDEPIQKHNFTQEVIDNPVITQVSFIIGDLKHKASTKARSFKEMWEDDRKKHLWDKKNKISIDKLIDKNPSTNFLELKMSYYSNMKTEYDEMPKERNAFFISVSFTSVIESFKVQAKDWLDRHGAILRIMGDRELLQIKKEIEDYHEKLRAETVSIDDLKSILNTIAEINDSTMVMEFRISDVMEKFRTLKMYNQNIEPIERLDEAFSLDDKWKELVKEAKLRDHKLLHVKKHFAKETKEEVSAFKSELRGLLQDYKNKGPGAPETSLDEGMESLGKYQALCMEKNKKKDALVLAEKLFNLDISTFQELVQIDEENKKLQKLYDCYREIKQSISDWSGMIWSKLDSDILKEGADTFEKKRKKLANDYAENPTYAKLASKITGFRDSIPLIQKLKIGSITERHWEKLMKETGRKMDFNMKTITLEQVFALQLQNYPEKVDEIVTEALNEAQNEEELNKIEAKWKTEAFEIVKYKKGNEDRGFVLKSTDEVKLLLDDQLLNLQAVASSRFVSAFLGRVRKWEHDLNRIAEVLDLWLTVQKKWIYLEGIFTGSDDIRQQLKEEAKRFDKNDKSFKKIMENAFKNPNILACCVLNEGRLMELKDLSEELDKRQKRLSDYLDAKRNIFPRFYFLSDEDLLSILGSSEPQAVQPHMLKLFDNCKELKLNRKLVLGMESDESEKFNFKEVQKAEKPVEGWMGKVDEEMQSTLKKITKESVFHYANKERTQWVLDNLGMVAIVGTQIWWTWRVEDVFRKVKEGNKYAMKQESTKQTKDLTDLIDIIRTELNSLDRKKINTLIIVDVHARDIVDRFVRDSILDAREFEWESQLRFYWDYQENDIRIRQCTGTFTYGYEYQGLNGRLVITPLTDRCVMTLTTALTFKLGGAPAGPAGTGKTETVKDLAKSLAIRCCVTNCSESMDYKAMGIIFSGLVQTGFWGCFDEFNRISPEVLSVVSVQIKTIQEALTKEKKTLELLKKELKVVSTVGIFVTMNPGYAGRTELPDNLKALFRPVTMVVPDMNMICEIMLMSEGFLNARVLAKKMCVLYKLGCEQLSKQFHYDFGLRALKSVLVMAGSLKREASDVQEDLTLMRALRDMNMPKFVFEDVPLFLGLITDLFPSMDIKRKGYEKRERINAEIENEGLTYISDQADKVIQLFETMVTRHTTMVVGPTGSGKSTVIDILKKVEKVFIFCMNPKAQTVNELYGIMDSQTREWKDGLLSKIFRIANEKSASIKEENRWLLYDGDVDAVWVENMNSVMDDNRLLTLINGDRIRLERFCKMLFEVSDLQYASPATISRCGMVYVDPKNLRYQPYFEKWMSKWKKQRDKYDTLIEVLNELFAKYVPPCINLIFEGIDEEAIDKPLQQILNRTDLNLVVQLCKLVESFLVDEDAAQDPDHLEFMFIFCLVWSLGSCIKPEQREKFQEFVRKISGRHLPPRLYDNFYDFNGAKVYIIFNFYFFNKIILKTWIPWEKLVIEYQPPPDGKFSKILVPTVDTKRFSWLLSQMVQNKWPAMFVGESGTAKSVIIQFYLNSLPVENYLKLNINFSSRTTSLDLQKTLEDNIDKKSGRNFGPKIPGKKLVVFIDDVHMPKVDIYGTQQPIALLKLLLDKGYMYERGGNLEMKIVKDTQFVSAMLPPGGGTNNVDPRFLSLFMTFSIIFPSYENLEKIYNSILKAHLMIFPEEIQLIGTKITTATLKLYETISAKLPRTPMKFHYIFNLRDLSRIYEGLLRSTVDAFDSVDKFVRLWRNECLRVFVDKLISEEDRKLISNETIPETLKEFFPAEIQDFVLKDPILIADYMMANPAEPEAIDPKVYKDCGGYEQVELKIKGILNDYNDNEKNKEMNLVLFKDALEHVTKIHRILRFPRGHALLVGFGGSGKQSLTRLATFCASYDIFLITLARGYKEKEFREDLKKLYENLTVKETVFLFTDSHVLEEGFLELVNNMLTIGMVPALFDEDGKKQMTERIRDEAKKKGIPESKDDLWNYFLDKVRDNLHIVLAMSPAGDVLRIRCRNFPGLVSNTCIDWFFPWPEEALISVCKFYLEEEDLPPEHRPNITDHIVHVHSSIQQFSKDFELQLKRKNFSTPKNYLDFLNNYKKFLGINRKKYTDMIVRYANGCKTLEKAAADVEVLQAQLEVKQKEVNAEKSEVEAIIEDIQQKTEIASKHQAAAVEKKAQLDIDNAEIEQKQNEAEVILKEAIPILQGAEKALNNIDPSDLVFLKALPSPKEAIKIVGTMLLILKPSGTEDEKDGWAGFKIMIGSPGEFVKVLQGFGKEINRITQRQIDRIKNHEKALENMGVGETELLSLSKACAGLHSWIQAMCKFYEVNKKVTPLRQRVEELSKKLAALRDELKETEELLDKLKKDLHELHENQIKKQATLDELTKEANIMERRLTAAKKLISGLGREQRRWTDDQALFDEKKYKLLGDCLLCSSFLSYVGPFDYSFRKKMIYEAWYQDLEKRAIPNSTGFRLEELLTSDVEISQWASEGLPSDELSVQNGILTTKSSRWPLCIDPQLQAVQWIKKKEEKMLTILNLNDGATAYLKMLENSIKFGKTVLFENVDVELDPTIDPVLEKNFVIKGAGVKYLRLGDNDIEFNEDFKLFLTTKLANPQYTPEIMGKTMVINYTVTLQGLWDQLLNVVVGFEKPEKEKQRLQLIHEMSENKKKLKDAEDELLKKLAENTGSLLDNEPLINTLEVSLFFFYFIEFDCFFYAGNQEKIY